MENLAEKTAFITGGASGIGLGMARAFLAEGMKVFLADIEADALEGALNDLRGEGGRAEGTLCDVSDRDAVMRAAEAVRKTFGAVHVLCNNAGIGAGGPFGTLRPSDWDWVLGVNLMGVVHGIDAFLPEMRDRGEGGHIVNTASMAGLRGTPGMGPYCAAKAAVVSISETLAGELEGSGIGVSVLCPGWVRTRILESARGRPQRFGPPRDRPANAEEAARYAAVSELIESGLDPLAVGRRVVEGIRREELYLITHPDWRVNVEGRFEAILASFDAAKGSPALAIPAPQLKGKL